MVRIDGCEGWGEGLEWGREGEKKWWLILNEDFLFDISGKIKRGEDGVVGRLG